MLSELRSEYPDAPIQILGVNEFGHESGNSLMSSDRVTPILQDVDANNNGSSDVWREVWDVTYRDVKILNQENELVGTVNLTPPEGYDLGEQANYNALKQIIADVARERPLWQNPGDPTDVNGDQRTSAIDALLCINEMMLGTVSGSDTNLPLPMPPLMPTPYLDVSGDGRITAIDALRVINRLLSQSGSAEGESLGSEGDSLVGERAMDIAFRDSTHEAGAELTPNAAKLSGADAEHHNAASREDQVSGPSESTGKTVSAFVEPMDADSSVLSSEAVDSVFGCNANPLVKDAISQSLLHDGSSR